jgi:glycosyltransferase involved in cell wall biosynthesis
MKFSVLLPTRNRLDLLSYAIETVRRQDYDDWELIVSDNCSDEDVEGYVESLGDSRIKYFRIGEFVPVTDNWSNALEKCDGDYVIMLGDDDCLMKGYFSTLNEIIEKYGSPDLVYTSAFLYAYPGVLPGCPEGFLRSYSQGRIFKSAQEPFWLDKAEAKTLAQSSLNFRIQFDYNMQFSLVSSKLIKEMAKYGRFYQSPYPDYYASNAMMLKAARILIAPFPLVTIGISPKSFGFYYFNDAESTGNQFLKNLPDPEMSRRLQPVVLPGTDMNTSWLLSMETLAQNFGGESDIRVNYRRYRFLQICAVYSGLILRKADVHVSLLELRRRLTVAERILYDLPLRFVVLVASILPDRYRQLISNMVIRATGSHPAHASANIEGKFTTILDVFEKTSLNTTVVSQEH